MSAAMNTDVEANPAAAAATSVDANPAVSSGADAALPTASLAADAALPAGATAGIYVDANPDAGSLRIGIGYDVHAFAAAEDGRRLVLGGVDIAYQRGLLGHSDADVLAHAVADALLGAARAGDIGQHFPDTDPRFAGADSLLLLAEVGELLRTRGWRVLDLDCVVVAQEPKISPYRDSMRVNIANALHIPTEAVGVKATTTEGLGFEGRGQGIAAQAVALITGDPGIAESRTPSTPSVTAVPSTPVAGHMAAENRASSTSAESRTPSTPSVTAAPCATAESRTPSKSESERCCR